VTIDELVGENLRRAREAVGISRSDLAQRVAAIGLPLDEADLEGLEAGFSPISVDALVALALALGVPPGLLLAPLNLGSLLCVDGEGRATASWSLFHDWARPFLPRAKPSALPAAVAAPAPEAPAPTPAAPVGEPPPATASPERVDISTSPGALPPDPPPPPPQESAGHQPAEPLPPGAPAPRPSSGEPPARPPDGTLDRDWAFRALRELHQVR